MTREVIRGETIPLERFSEEFKRRARLVSAEALKRSGVVPRDVMQVLEARDEDLRKAQKIQKMTFTGLDAWMQKQIDSL